MYVGVVGNNLPSYISLFVTPEFEISLLFINKTINLVEYAEYIVSGLFELLESGFGRAVTVTIPIVGTVKLDISNPPGRTGDGITAGNAIPPAGGATPAGGTPSGGTPSITGFANLPSRSATPVGAIPSTQLIISASSDTATTTPLVNLILGAIVGGIVSGLILISLACLCFFLVRKYGRKNEAIAIPEPNNNVNRNTPIDLVISNQEQEFTPNLPNYNNQQGTTCELGNNSTDNEIIQNIKKGKLSFIIDEKIIEEMKKDVLRDVKQELKEKIRIKFIGDKLNLADGYFARI
ncbi:16846_t:CDS:2 [Rhizophagus irregularis]|nr:16846_t:CDS:2 [Rhizophagus irregularis]